MCEVKAPFGVELEFSSRRTSYSTLLSQLQTICENRGSTLSESEGLEHWTLKHDCSCGFELTTPRLEGEDGLNHLCLVAKDLQHENAGNSLVDRSCGMHVHIGIEDITRRQLQNIFVAFQRLEPLTLLTVPPSRNDNNYCRRISDWRAYDGRLELPTDHSDGVNFMGWNYRGDMEIRYGAGTCDHNKIRHWVLYIQGVLGRACEVGPPENSIDNPDGLEAWLGEEGCPTVNWVRERYNRFRGR